MEAAASSAAAASCSRAARRKIETGEENEDFQEGVEEQFLLQQRPEQLPAGVPAVKVVFGG